MKEENGKTKDKGNRILVIRETIALLARNRLENFITSTQKTVRKKADRVQRKAEKAREKAILEHQDALKRSFMERMEPLIPTPAPYGSYLREQRETLPEESKQEQEQKPNKPEWDMATMGNPFKSDKFGTLLGDSSEEPFFRHPSVSRIYGGKR